LSKSSAFTKGSPDEQNARSRQRYVVVGSRPWNRKLFDDVISQYEGEWHFIESREALTPEKICAIVPRFLFFLHWSWKVPDEIVHGFECVCFHMTDVPFGRGGSPLQNLIVRGQQETKVAALRMTREIDAGPVYLREPLSLQGRAQDIYIRAGEVAAKMIARIIQAEIVPEAQTGEVVMFKRRKPEESNVAKIQSLSELYDHIRMLDAEEYPHAFLEAGQFRMEFVRAVRHPDRVVAEVSITQLNESPE
jgi:methionyl-tRNA formyltransferase